MKASPRGCLETAGIVVFALAVGALTTSTVLRHRGAPERDPADPPPERAELLPEARARIRVEVLNGSGSPGAAARMTEFLRRQGFDVVDFGNAERFDHPRTTVLDRTGDSRAAREVAAALLGVPIRTAPDSTLFLDVTVIVGDDRTAGLDGSPEETDQSRLERVRAWLERLPTPWR